MSSEWVEKLEAAREVKGAGGKPRRPVNWNRLLPEEAELAWHNLDSWLHWLRRTYGLPAAVLPPFWYRHSELVWELSALHEQWLAAYEDTTSITTPLAWHQDFAQAQQRLREWVASASASARLDRDRATRQTVWPGESAVSSPEELVILDRQQDFARFVSTDIEQRQEAATRAGDED